MISNVLFYFSVLSTVDAHSETLIIPLGPFLNFFFYVFHFFLSSGD